MSFWNFLRSDRRSSPHPACAECRLRRGSILFIFLSSIVFLGGAKAQKDNALLIKKGKALYQAHCIVCHHANPKIVGTLGPEISKTSLKLLEARIKRAEYPAGYKPKRTTKLMVALPQLTDDDIKALHAFLNQ